jgi:hypothetical protein
MKRTREEDNECADTTAVEPPPTPAAAYLPTPFWQEIKGQIQTAFKEQY